MKRSLYSSALFIVLSFNCFQVKQVANFNKVRREIESVSSVVIIDLVEVQESKTEPHYKWDRIKSNRCDSIVFSKISLFIKKFSKRKKFHVETVPYKPDSTLRVEIGAMFEVLEGIENVNEVYLDEMILNSFSWVNSRYLLLINQDGYCFTKEYLRKVEHFKVGQFFFNAIGAGTLVKAGAGVFLRGKYDEGFSRIGVALIDRSLKSVLFYSQRTKQGNPLGDSTILYQLESNFRGF